MRAFHLFCFHQWKFMLGSLPSTRWTVLNQWRDEVALRDRQAELSEHLTNNVVSFKLGSAMVLEMGFSLIPRAKTLTFLDLLLVLQ